MRRILIHIKLSNDTIYNIFDVGGELTVTISRRKTLKAFKEGKHIIDHYVTDSRISTKIVVSTTIAKEW